MSVTKAVVYVRTEEEALKKAAELKEAKQPNFRVVIMPSEVFQALEKRQNEQNAKRAEHYRKGLEAQRSYSYDAQSSRMSQLKHKLFGTYLVDEQTFKEAALSLLKEESVKAKLKRQQQKQNELLKELMSFTELSDEQEAGGERL
jgi:hypothetical protein